MSELPSVGLKDLLVAQGFTFGGSADWAIYIGARPVTPNRSLTIADTGGTEPSPRWLLDFPSAQIIVRGNEGDYKVARDKAQEVKDILLGTPSQDLNGDRWLHVNMAGEIGFIGFDDSDRPLFSLNFNLIIEPAPTPNSNRLPI